MKRFSESYGRFKVSVGNKEPKGFPVFLRVSGYPTYTVSHHKTISLANAKAKAHFKKLIK